MNILLTSSGRRSYLVSYFKSALQGRGLVHASNSEYSPALNVADRHVITPLIYEDSYINFILNYAIENDITAIIPLFDIDLPVLSDAKEIFRKAGIKVVVSDHETTIICNDKWKSYMFLENNGFQTPKTYLNYNKVLEELRKNIIKLPLVIKPRWGMGSKGVYIADDEKELEVFYKKAMKEVKSTYLKYEAKNDFDECIIIQEYIEGSIHGLEAVNDLDGNHITTFVTNICDIRFGESYSAVTDNNVVLKQLGLALSEKLKHIGVMDIDCISSHMFHYIIDLNVRFGGLYPFAHLAGANIPLAIINWLDNVEPDKELFKIKYGVKSVKDIVPMLYF